MACALNNPRNRFANTAWEEKARKVLKKSNLSFSQSFSLTTHAIVLPVLHGKKKLEKVTKKLKARFFFQESVRFGFF